MRRAFVLLLLLAANTARAQIPAGEPPTPGVYNPTLGIVSDADASAVEKNPALLGWLKSWSGVFLATEILDRNSVVGGTGEAIFLATPVPLLSSLVVGAGLQYLRPPVSFPYADQGKLNLAVAWRVFPALSFGLDYAHLWSQRGPNLDTLDLSITMRARWLGAALLVRDVNQPLFDGLPIQREWIPDVAVRPFGTAALELALGAIIGERRGNVNPLFRMWFSPVRGLTVKTEVQWRRDTDLDGTEVSDVRAALGLQLDLEHIGVGGYALFGTNRHRTEGNGFTISARISGERYPALWAGPIHLQKLQLGPGITDRKLTEMLMKLHALERDRGVAGVLVILGELDGGWATVEELRAALLKLRHAGKHVFIYLADTTTRGYYVASAGERIFLDPAGGLRLTGLSSSTLFYKGLGDKIGVQADFVKIGEYKSAPEAYTRTGPTEPARRQREAFVQDTYDNLVNGIAVARHVTPERVRQWIDRGPYTATEALRAGVVDEVKMGDELEDSLTGLLGRRIALKDPPHTPARGRAWMDPKIAVINVMGDIVDGKSYEIPILGMKFVGLQSLLPAIQKARDDGRIKAIVIRVDSPGGSALASDLLARELDRTKEVKPVVCSFGDLAASGGYFLAAPCQRIYAAPSTLTGSIGIFSGKFDVSGLAAKLGVTFELYERGTHASIESMYRPYSEDERKLLLEKLRYYYGRFVDAVARGRGLSRDQVDAIGRGHIWSGRAAQIRGLVDEFGGVTEAIAEAKRRAHLHVDEPVEIVEMPDEPSLLGTLLGLFGIELHASAKEDPVAKALATVPGLRELLAGVPGSVILEPSVPQARMEEMVIVR
jgi:protease-4